MNTFTSNFSALFYCLSYSITEQWEGTKSRSRLFTDKFTIIFRSFIFLPFLALFGCSQPYTGFGSNTTPWKASVVITSPSESATVSGKVSVQVIVNDSTPNTSVSNLFLYIDGNQQVNSIYDNPPPFNWYTSNVKDGTHILQVQAEICQNGRNDICDYFYSQLVRVIVNNAPVWNASVIITSPSVNAKVSGADTVKFRVVNNTPASNLAGVSLLVDGICCDGDAINDSTALFYTVNIANGIHNLTVSAHIIEDGGIYSHDFLSDPVSVVVKN